MHTARLLAGAKGPKTKGAQDQNTCLQRKQHSDHTFFWVWARVLAYQPDLIVPPLAAPTGDVWYFPANLPHSLVGLEPEGCQFVSGFNSPSFDELTAFSASTWLATLPVDTLAQVRSCVNHWTARLCTAAPQRTQNDRACV